MARVFVADGDDRSALAVVRSLGRAGHAVIVGAPRLRSLAGASRFASERAALPDALKDPEAFAAAASDAVRRLECEFILPVTDASALAVLSHVSGFAPARVLMPTLESFQRLSDKGAVAEAASTVGVRVPRQVTARSGADVAGLAASGAVAPPLVLKPSRSVAEGAAGRTKHGVRHAASWAEAAAVAGELPDGAFPLLIQERIVGEGTGVFVLLWEGRLVAAFMHRRIREKPPAGGVSVLCESAPLDSDLLPRSKALLDHFGWSGVAMVEYKRDAATGEAVLMEVNGRFWGSLQLAVDAGVDFPRLLLECALGRSPAPVTAYRVGVRNRWWWGDFDNLLTRLRHSDAALHLQPGTPGRVRTGLDFVATAFAGASGQVFQRDDPGPAWRELRDRVREMLRL